MKNLLNASILKGLWAGGAATLSVLSSCQIAPAQNSAKAPSVQPVAQARPLNARQPNIVFILADDLGYKDLGCYGSTFYDTPNLDKLAKQGVLFTDAYAACPVCSPTRASLLTGQYPQRTGITDYLGAGQPEDWKRNTKLLPAPYAEQLALDKVTMAEMLKGQGYATGFFGKWHLGPEGFWPEDQGFDVNKGGTDAGAPPRGGGRYFSPYDNPRLSDGPKGEHLPARLATEVNSFMEANRAQPFFAYLSFYSVHTPIMARADLEAKYQKRAQERGLVTKVGKEGDVRVRLSQDNPTFAGMVDAMDEAAGKVLDKLKELGLEENTIVVFTSDNGGLSTGGTLITSNAPLRAGKGWMYEGGIREPLLVRWPGVTTAGTVSQVPVSSPDFYPTFMNAVGAPTPADQPLDGIDLKPVLQGQAVAPRALFWGFPHYHNQGGTPAAAVRMGNWKLIHWFEDDTFELYDLSNDSGETNNLAAREPARVKAMNAQIESWQKQVGAKNPTPNPNYKLANKQNATRGKKGGKNRAKQEADGQGDE